MAQLTARELREEVQKRMEDNRKMALAESGLPANVKSLIQATQLTIGTNEVRDAISAYGLVLELTKQVFGEENLTEEVMTTAITAGSYAMWRGIMGPKIPESPTAPKGARRI